MVPLYNGVEGNCTFRYALLRTKTSQDCSLEVYRGWRRRVRKRSLAEYWPRRRWRLYLVLSHRSSNIQTKIISVSARYRFPSEML
jgi:hypothetical protein